MSEKYEQDPLKIFHEWLEHAQKSEINDPDAMALATATKEGKPSVRMILLKEASDKGFKFHTNCESQKGLELAENPFAALCFHWKSLRKQIRIEGKIKQVSVQEANDYFQNRPYARKIGAHASQQSRPLESRDYLEQRIKEIGTTYPNSESVPRPSYWVGYRVLPEKIEFWWDNPDRLHDRLRYTKKSQGNWDITRLYP